MTSQDRVLPDTQNVDAVALTQEPIASQQLVPWGKLCPLRTTLKGLEMTRDRVYTVGRVENCDICMTTQEMKLKWLSVISKVHFRIYRERVGDSNETVVYLEDLSQNGTFVDKVLVGRGNRVIIENDSEIAVAKIDFTVYRFTNTIMSGNSCLPPEIKQKYAMGRKLGSGACGEVRMVFTKDGTKRFAMKIIMKHNFITSGTINPFNDPQKIRNEVEILKKLKHSCIIRMEDICDTPTAVYIILELMEGGELFDRIKSRGRLSESCAKLIFYQVILAVHYLHKEGITHRDLKPENILLATNSDVTIAKVSDFGLSKFVDAKTLMKTFCGTPMYVAPEILATFGRNSYTSQVDVWSLGVILYVCLSGSLPFAIHSQNHTLEEQIRRGMYSFPQSHFEHVSKDAIELIKRMMTVNPKRRITVPQILLHPWLRDASMREIVNTLITPANDENAPPSNVQEEQEADLFFEFTKRARLQA